MEREKKIAVILTSFVFPLEKIGISIKFTSREYVKAESYLNRAKRETRKQSTVNS